MSVKLAAKIPQYNQSIRAIPLPDQTVRTLASSIFKHLRSEGCQTNDIISVSTQLLSLVTTEIAKDRAQS